MINDAKSVSSGKREEGDNNEKITIERTSKPRRIANTVKVGDIDRDKIKREYLLNERDPEIRNVEQLPKARFAMKTKTATIVDQSLKKKVELSAKDVFTNKHQHSPTKNPIKRSYARSQTIVNSAPIQSNLINDIELFDKPPKKTTAFAFHRLIDEDEIEEDFLQLELNEKNSRNSKFMTKGSHQINFTSNLDGGDSNPRGDNNNNEMSSFRTASKFKPTKKSAEDTILSQVDFGQLQLKTKPKPKTNTALPVVFK